MVPEEFEIQFSSVRKLTPREFVEKLLKEFGVRGVVAGKYIKRHLWATDHCIFHHMSQTCIAWLTDMLNDG